MKRIILISLVLLVIPFLGFAQLSKNKNLSYEDVLHRVNSLMQVDRQMAVDSLNWEAQHLENLKTLASLTHARTIYLILQMEEKQAQVTKEIISLYPNSSFGLSNSFVTIFNRPLSIEEMEVEFLTLKSKHQQDIDEYDLEDFLLSKWIRVLIEKEDLLRVEYYLTQVMDANYKNGLQMNLVWAWFNAEKWEELEPILFRLHADETQPASSKRIIAQLYSKTLINLGKDKEAFKILSSYAEHFIIDKEDMLVDYVNGLYINNRKTEGFGLIDSYLKRTIPSEEFVVFAKDKFAELNGSANGWNAYYKDLSAIKLRDKVQFWEKSMINEKAIDFSLLDLNGALVKLDDFKGKIIILDFWATWCGPCVGSFPGMQAAVNHFKNDKDVVFLFINTREQSSNYKEKVANFIRKNNYSFHVVFDHMGNKVLPLVDAYEIKGIPAKYFIDKHGNIRFKSTGSSSNTQEVLEEVIEKINLIKKNS